MIERIKIDHIVPNPFQYREIFDEESIKELAQSFGGQQPTQPIVVYHFLSDEFNLIIAGERRWRAAKLAGLKELDCIVRCDLTGREPDDPEILGLGALENIQCEELSPVETGKMIAEHRKRTGLSQEQLAKEWGKSPMWINRHERFTKLTHNIMLGVNTGVISPTIGFELVKIEEKSKQDKVLQAMNDTGMVNSMTAQRGSKCD
jgi:ParB family chromosome partitioning protein